MTTIRLKVHPKSPQALAVVSKSKIAFHNKSQAASPEKDFQTLKVISQLTKQFTKQLQ